MLSGIGASKGYGIGRAVIVEDISLDYTNVEYSTSENEISRLKSAVQEYILRTKSRISSISSAFGSHEAEILNGHITMLSDPFMLDQMESLIHGGAVAEKAVDSVCSSFVDMFLGVDDELTRQRATDIRDIRDSLIALLLDVRGVDIASLPVGSILVTKDITPSMTSQINPKSVCAIVTESGGVTSHSAILARAMGVPAVLSVKNATRDIFSGETLIVDGFKGRVIKSPSQQDIEEFSKKQNDYLSYCDGLIEYFGKPTVTRSGATKKVCANIGRAEDVQNVIQNSGEGIGLFRTEFLFMDRDSEPSELEQIEAYSTVAKAMNGREVIIRTLDIGGDKPVPYLHIEKEENPFLGHRGIRYCLDNPDIFKKQLRAILQAALYGDVKIMLPLVTTLDEVFRARSLIAECKVELDAESKRYKDVPLGVMIETPSAVAISDMLAQEVDFFSIGTNDLTGYTMAVDRGNPLVSHLYNVYNPSVLRLIEHTIKNAKRFGIPVGMCGESASDEGLIPQLLEWGLDEFSVNPSMILQTRKIICEI